MKDVVYNSDPAASVVFSSVSLAWWRLETKSYSVNILLFPFMLSAWYPSSAD